MRGSLFVPLHKRLAVQQSLETLLSMWRASQPVSVRAVASVQGTLPIAMMMTRQMAIWCAGHVRSGRSYDQRFLLSCATSAELSFWLRSFGRFDGFRPIWPHPGVRSITVYTDAAGACPDSFGGWGGWLADTTQGKRCVMERVLRSHASSMIFCRQPMTWLHDVGGMS